MGNMSGAAGNGLRLTRRKLLRGAVVGGVALGATSVLACAPTTQAPAASSAAASGAAAPRHLGTLRFAQAFDLDTLDPTRVVQTPWRRVYGHLFDAPMHRVPKDGALESVPKLAEKVERLDGRTYVFTLRKDVRFSNGEPLTAQAFVFTREKMLDPTSQAAGNAGQVASIEVLDDLRMRVVMKVTDPFAIDQIWTDAFFPVPPKAYAAAGPKDFAQRPIGTGPYALEEWQQGDRIALKARPDYWGGTPLADRVIIRVMPDPSTRVAALLAKEVDIVEGVTPVLAAQIKSSDSARISLAPGSPQPIWGSLMTDRPPLNDKRVRQAINYAVNKEAIVQRVLQGFGEVMGQPCASDTECYNANVKPYPYDAKKARELLDAAGVRDVTIPFQFSSGVAAGAREVAQAVAGDLAAVGIRTNPVDVERGVFLRNFTDGVGRHKDFGDISIMYYAGGVQPQTVALRRVVVSTDSWNSTHYANPEVDRLIKESDQEFDAGKRKQLYDRIAQIVHDDAPWLFLYAPKSIWGVSKTLKWEAQADDMLWVMPENFPL